MLDRGPEKPMKDTRREATLAREPRNESSFTEISQVSVKRLLQFPANERPAEVEEVMEWRSEGVMDSTPSLTHSHNPALSLSVLRTMTPRRVGRHSPPTASRDVRIIPYSDLGGLEGMLLARAYLNKI